MPSVYMCGPPLFFGGLEDALMADKPTYEELQQRVKDLDEAALKRKDAKEALRKAHDELERRVEERTAALVKANEQLEKEIQERKQAEKSLLREKNFSEVIIDSLPGSFYLFDDKGRFLRWNKNFEEVSGYSAEEISKMHAVDFFIEEDRRNVAQRIQEVFVKGKSSVEAVLVSKSGYKTPYYLTGLRVTIGNKTYLGGMGLDITERKRAEEALRESEEKYRTISGTAQDAIVMMDDQGNISYWNPAAERIFGYSPEEVIGKELHLLLGPQRYHQAYKKGFETFRETGRGAAVGKTLELSAIRRDGTEFPIELSVTGLQIKGKRHATGIIRDITERKQAEEALKKAHDELERRVEERTAELAAKNKQLELEIAQHMRTEEALKRSEREKEAILYALDATSESIAYQDTDMKVLWANAAAGESVGEPSEHLVGRYCYEVWHQRSEPCVGCPVVETLTTGQPREIEITYPDGRIWLHRGYAVRDKEGDVLGVVATMLDITGRKHAEEALRKSEKQLRMLSAQLLAAQEKERERVANELHDSVGQALTAIKFRVENTLGQLDKTTAKGVIESLETVVPVVQYATEEVRRIAMGLRPSTLDDLGLLATIAWFCREFQGIYSMIRIEKDIDIEEPEVPEHLKTDIYRILQESLNNVAKHSNADRVRLSLRKADSTIELVIEDNGLGFDLEGTLPSEISGKGLGLSSMRERSEISGGFFAIESTRGRGTTVRAAWPVNRL
jgi:PAS domain S-box-containing protein